MKTTFSFLCFAIGYGLAMCQYGFAGTVTFGSGASQFQMDFVTIGDPGNAPDTDPNAQPLNSGSVAYTFGIGKFEVSEDMIRKYNTYNPSQQIVIDERAPNMPATAVSWNEAARFVNWLNTVSGYPVAYNFTNDDDVNTTDIELWDPSDAGYDELNPYRNKLAIYALPSSDEWYKAAYYHPRKAKYFNYSNGRNSPPIPVAYGFLPNTAVYGGQPSLSSVDSAGGLSPYGVMGMSGNVMEWEESSLDLLNSSGASLRGLRGGNYEQSQDEISKYFRIADAPSWAYYNIGFRVVTLKPSPNGGGNGEVPEPSTMAIFFFGTLALACRAGRRRVSWLSIPSISAN